MNGPEHYKEAEQIVAMAKGRDLPIGAAADIAAVAQVHATLALAAATAEGLVWRAFSQRDGADPDWSPVLSGEAREHLDR
jgi:hypothetical protein